MANTLSNPKVEKVVLGAMLANDQAYWDLCEILNVSCFASPDHQKVWTAIHEQALAGRAVRVSIIAGHISGLSDDADPDAYLSALLHAATQEEGLPLEDFAYELRELANTRSIRSIAEGMMKATEAGPHDAKSIMDRAMERLSDLAREASAEHETTLSATVRQIARSSGSGGTPGMQACLSGLTEMVGSFMPATLVLWGGGPGSAKTAIAMQQALHSSASHPTTLFELEMDNKAVVARSLTARTGIPGCEIMSGLNERQIEKVMAMEHEWASRKMRLVFPPQMTIQQIRSRALHHKRNHGLDLLIVDHIKLIRRPSKFKLSDHERAYENAADLKALAKDVDCCVIALCQFTKSARQKETPEPEMEDFYGGSLEEHADVMLANLNRNDWLQKNPPKTNGGKAKERWDDDCRMSKDRIEVFKLKDRFGPGRDRKIFHWNGAKTLFTDLDDVQPDLLQAYAEASGY